LAFHLYFEIFNRNIYFDELYWKNLL